MFGFRFHIPKCQPHKRKLSTKPDKIASHFADSPLCVHCKSKQRPNTDCAQPEPANQQAADELPMLKIHNIPDMGKPPVQQSSKQQNAPAAPAKQAEHDDLFHSPPQRQSYPQGCPRFISSSIFSSSASENSFPCGIPRTCSGRAVPASFFSVCGAKAASALSLIHI